MYFAGELLGAMVGVGLVSWLIYLGLRRPVASALIAGVLCTALYAWGTDGRDSSSNMLAAAAWSWLWTKWGRYRESTRRTCPFCAETIKPTAVVCRYCGKDQPAAPITPEKSQEPAA